MRAFSHILSQGRSVQPLLWGSNGSREIRSPSYSVVCLVAHSAPLTLK